MILFLLALVVINKVLYRSFLNPIFLQSVVWLIYYVILALNIKSYNVYLRDVEPFILIQSIGFSLGGFLCMLFTRTSLIYQKTAVHQQAIERAGDNIRLLYPAVLMAIIGCTIFLLNKLGTFSVYSIMEFRDKLGEDDGKDFGPIGLVQLLLSVYVILYIATLRKRQQAWYKPALLIGLFCYFTLLLGSKGQFLSFFAATFYILLWQKRVSKKIAAFAVIAFIGLLAFLLVLRAGNDADLDNDSFKDLVLIYSATALPALYLEELTTSKVFGYYTLRVMYVWLNKFGFDFPVAPVLSDWVVTPLPTNVYSYLMPYYNDFGYIGIFMLPLLLGILHNYFYFRANKGSLIFLVLSALFLFPLAMQVFEENYFRQMTNWLYVAIVVFGLTKIKLSSRRQMQTDVALSNLR